MNLQPDEELKLRSALAAKLFGALTLVVVAFQLALAAGAPWGFEMPLNEH